MTDPWPSNHQPARGVDQYLMGYTDLPVNAANIYVIDAATDTHRLVDRRARVLAQAVPLHSSWDGALHILAGLDQRYGWTGAFHPAAQIFALIVCASGYALVVWATASNAFFSQIVRIQSDRGQTVATHGPYRFVRHPGYVGMILFELAISTLLASWWAVMAGGFCAFLLILRTALEDRTLRSELAGYADYARQVRYRLLPGIW